MNYSELSSSQPPSSDNYFFAFSDEQFNEQKAKVQLKEGEKLIAIKGLNMFGTKQAIDDFFNFYEQKRKEIAEKCDPQEVYNYEFNSHECSYVCDDEEAIKIVIDYFGEERAKTVKRRYARLVIL